MVNTKTYFKPISCQFSTDVLLTNRPGRLQKPVTTVTGLIKCHEMITTICRLFCTRQPTRDLFIEITEILIIFCLSFLKRTRNNFNTTKPIFRQRLL